MDPAGLPLPLALGFSTGPALGLLGGGDSSLTVQEL